MEELEKNVLEIKENQRQTEETLRKLSDDDRKIRNRLWFFLRAFFLKSIENP